MKLTGNEDIRIRRSIISIRKAFEELICEREYGEITVTELSERAMINKKTFYQYYTSLDDLLREVQEELSTEYAQRISGLGLKDMHRLVEEFYLFSEEKGAYYEKITCGNSYSAIRQTMMDRVVTQSGGFPELEKLDAALGNILEAYINAVIFQVYSQWILDNKKMPVKEVIEITTNLLLNGMGDYIR